VQKQYLFVILCGIYTVRFFCSMGYICCKLTLTKLPPTPCAFPPQALSLACFTAPATIMTSTVHCFNTELRGSSLKIYECTSCMLQITMVGSRLALTLSMQAGTLVLAQLAGVIACSSGMLYMDAFIYVRMTCLSKLDDAYNMYREFL